MIMRINSEKFFYCEDKMALHTVKTTREKDKKIMTQYTTCNLNLLMGISYFPGLKPGAI